VPKSQYKIENALSDAPNESILPFTLICHGLLKTLPQIKNRLAHVNNHLA
jgi:hypothetical protein